MGKILSSFIDESGDVGFIKDTSKYYIITFVMHNQTDDIKSNIEKIKDYSIFHGGPMIRREYPFDNMEMTDSYNRYDYNIHEEYIIDEVSFYSFHVASISIYVPNKG